MEETIEKKFSVKGIIIRFFVFYPIVLITIGFLIKLAGINLGSGVNIAIVIVILMLLVEKFAKENQRYFDDKEFNNVFCGIVLIDVFYQFVFLQLAGAKGLSSIYAMVFGLILIGALHGIGVYVILKFMKKNLIKRKIISETNIGIQAED